jgi:RNA polymerase sigma-70 factor (ECF subfamily)
MDTTMFPPVRLTPESVSPGTYVPSGSEDEGVLVGRCLNGDADAFCKVTERYYRPVSAFLLRRVSRTDVVEDLAQETFLEAFRSLRAGRRPERLASWLFGIAHNVSGKWLRRRRPLSFADASQAEEVAAQPVASLTEELEEQQHQLAALETSLAELPEDARQLLDLKHRQGLTCTALADQLGKPVGTIKSLLSRTYRILRARLAPGGDERR